MSLLTQVKAKKAKAKSHSVTAVVSVARFWVPLEMFILGETFSTCIRAKRCTRPPINKEKEIRSPKINRNYIRCGYYVSDMSDMVILCSSELLLQLRLWGYIIFREKEFSKYLIIKLKHYCSSIQAQCGLWTKLTIFLQDKTKLSSLFELFALP